MDREILNLLYENNALLRRLVDRDDSRRRRSSPPPRPSPSPKRKRPRAEEFCVYLTGERLGDTSQQVLYAYFVRYGKIDKVYRPWKTRNQEWAARIVYSAYDSMERCLDDKRAIEQDFNVVCSDYQAVARKKGDD